MTTKKEFRQDDIASAIEELELELSRKKRLHLKRLLKSYIENFEEYDNDYTTADYIKELEFYKAVNLYKDIENEIGEI